MLGYCGFSNPAYDAGITLLFKPQKYLNSRSTIAIPRRLGGTEWNPTHDIKKTEII